MKLYFPPDIRLLNIHREAARIIKKYRRAEMEAILCLVQEKQFKNAYFHKKDTTVHSTVLQDIVPNYTSYISFLESKKIIKVNPYFVVGKTSKSYSFTFNYYQRMVANNVDIRAEQILNKIQVKKQSKYKIDTYIKELGKFFAFLDFDIEKAREESEKILDQRLACPDLTKTKNHKPFKHLTRWVVPEQTKNPFEQHHYAEDIMEKLQSRIHNPGRDQTGKRYHTLLTMLPKEYRKFCTCDGNRLVSTDLSNSQPFLSLLLFDPSFWYYAGMPARNLKLFKRLFPAINTPALVNLKTIGMEEHLGRNYDIYHGIIKAISKLGPDFSIFSSESITGNLYTYMGAAFKTRFNRHLTRAAIKEMIFIIFFSSNKSTSRGQAADSKRLFREIFPSIFDVFKKIKTQKKDLAPVFFDWKELPKRSSLLAIMLQRIESHVFLDVIANRLVTDYKYIPIYTLHDSIVTFQKHQGKVHDLVKAEITKHIGFTPDVKVETW